MKLPPLSVLMLSFFVISPSHETCCDICLVTPLLVFSESCLVFNSKFRWQTSMNISFDKRTALVTGAGRGIGRALVKKLVECDAKVIAVSKTKEHLDSLKKELPQIETCVVDLSDWEATKKLISQLGPVDLLVNNAACSEDTPIGNITEEQLDRQLNVNVKAIVNVTQEVAKGMIKRGKFGCSIVNVSSQASTAALKGHLVYGATKAAVDQMTRVMALELGEHQIRVNAVNPTVVWTEMGKSGWSDPVKVKSMTDKIPLHRFAEVKDVVNAIVYLLSDNADMINGTCLPIDGGFLAC